MVSNGEATVIHVSRIGMLWAIAKSWPADHIGEPTSYNDRSVWAAVEVSEFAKLENKRVH